MAKNSYAGKGQIFFGVYGQPLIARGNASELNLTITETETTELDYTTPGGGEINSYTRIESVGGNAIFYDWSPRNLADFLRGNSAVVAGGAVVGELVVAKLDALNVLAKLPDLNQTITVTNDTSTITYVEKDDYTITPAGLVILSTGTIGADAPILVDYTALTSDDTETLINTAQEYSMVLSGLNEVRSGKSVVVTVHRMKLAPPDALALLGNDFSTIDIPFKILADSTIEATGLSQFVKIQQAQ